MYKGNLSAFQITKCYKTARILALVVLALVAVGIASIPFGLLAGALPPNMVFVIGTGWLVFGSWFFFAAFNWMDHAFRMPRRR